MTSWGRGGGHGPASDPQREVLLVQYSFLINFQLTTPAGLRGVESMESWKVINSNFQFNYWISRGLESLVMQIGGFPCDFAF